jgi:hypothetical protein
MTPDQYLQSQLAPILQPGERVFFTAYMRRQPGLLMQLLLVGGLLLFLMTKAYFAVLTDRRLILIQTKMGFWFGGPTNDNLGMEQYDARTIKQVTTSGFLNNRSMTFLMTDGTSQTLRIAPWFKQVAGTGDFFNKVPDFVNQGQLQQAAAAAGALPQGGGYPQAGGYPQTGAPGLAPGARVTVLAPDGQRYPGTVVQMQQGQVLCAMPNGQQHWFPAQNVMPG